MLRSALIALIRFYQRGVSGWTPASCRFSPTCSAYAIQALETHGVWRGSRLAAGRLLRCHPWGGAGYDPVPVADDVGAALVSPTSGLARVSGIGGPEDGDG